MSLLACLAAPDPRDTAALHRKMWLDLANRAAHGSVPRVDLLIEVISLALATLPSPDVQLRPQWLRWVVDTFNELVGVVGDLDDADQQALVVGQIGDDFEPDPDDVVAMFEVEVRAELDALLSGPTWEALR